MGGMGSDEGEGGTGGVPARKFQHIPVNIVTRDVLLVGRAKLDCLEGGTHEETLRPQVNPKVECQRFRATEVLSRLLKDPRIR